MARRSPGSIISSVSRIPSNLNGNNTTVVDDNDEVAVNHAHTKTIVEWSYENEEILAEWGDIAQCYRWLNHHTHDYYSFLNAWFTIPTITFSTISGTASFATASIPLPDQPYATMAIGCINILIGILTTIQQYLKVAELKEAHRLAALAWDKYARSISIELTKTPQERVDAGTFLKFSRREFDRLMESTQSIPPHIIRKFRDEYEGRTDEERRRFRNIKKPDICDVIVSINDKRRKWFTEQDSIDAARRLSLRSSAKMDLGGEEDDADMSDGSYTAQEYEINRANTDMNRTVGSEVGTEVTGVTGATKKEGDKYRDIEQSGGSAPPTKYPPVVRDFSRENLLKHDIVLRAEDEEEKKRRWGFLPTIMTPTPTPTPPRRVSSREYLDTMKNFIQQPITGIRDSFLKSVFRHTPSEDGETPRETPTATPRMNLSETPRVTARPEVMGEARHSSPKSTTNKSLPERGMGTGRTLPGSRSSSRPPSETSGKESIRPGAPVQISYLRPEQVGRRSTPTLRQSSRSERSDPIPSPNPSPTRPPTSDPTSRPVTLVPFQSLPRPPPVSGGGPPSVMKKRVTHEEDYIVMVNEPFPAKAVTATPVIVPPIQIPSTSPDGSPQSSMSDESSTPRNPPPAPGPAPENIVITLLEDGAEDTPSIEEELTD